VRPHRIRPGSPPKTDPDDLVYSKEVTPLSLLSGARILWHRSKHLTKAGVPMRLMRFAFVGFVYCLLAVIPNGYSQSLAALSTEDRSSIEMACIVAKSQGPSSYHQCLNQQLRELGNSTAPSLDALSSDDRSSIEMACIVAKSRGPWSYHQCLNQQLRDLGNSTAPSLDAFSSDDRSSIEMACIVAKSNGPSSYHRCLNQQLSELQSPSAQAGAARTKSSERRAVPTTQSVPAGQLSNDRYYTNSDGKRIHSPAYSSGGSPAGATAVCTDGTYSFSQHRSGTCSHHGGVARWF
jgi:hypothetical protein